jgi:hypothetical protein
VHLRVSMLYVWPEFCKYGGDLQSNNIHCVASSCHRTLGSPHWLMPHAGKFPRVCRDNWMTRVFLAI